MYFIVLSVYLIRHISSHFLSFTDCDETGVGFAPAISLSDGSVLSERQADTRVTWHITDARTHLLHSLSRVRAQNALLPYFPHVFLVQITFLNETFIFYHVFLGIVAST